MLELTSAWEDGVPEPTLTANLNTNFQHQVDQHRFDTPGDPFPQTLGFVNREFGEPAVAYTSFSGGVPGTLDLANIQCGIQSGRENGE